MTLPPDGENVVAAGSSGMALPAAGRSGWSIHWMVKPLVWVVVLLFSRGAVFFIRPQFYAEDAAVLFLEARSLGWHSLFTPHPAYCILGDRLVSCAATILPALYQPAAYCYGALAYTLLTAWFCLRARLDHLMDRRGKIALALAIVLVPHDGEVLMKLIGVQWILMAILLILMLQDQPATPGEAVVDFLGLGLAGLTGPYSVLYAPWFLLRLRRVTGGFSRYNLLLIGAAWFLAGVQACVMVYGGLPGEPFTDDARQWSKELGFVFPGGLFFGESTPIYLGRAFYVISPVLLGLLAWALWRGERNRLWAALALLGCGAASYAGGLKSTGSMVLVLNAFGGGSRYFYPFYLFSMWVAVMYCFDRSERLRTAARIALAMMLLAAASNFTSPQWPNLHWDNFAPALDDGAKVDGVPVLPDVHVDFPATR